MRCYPILGICLMVLWLTPSLYAINDYEELCRLFKNGTLIRKPGTCNEYIDCIDGEGTLQFCPSTQNYFNPTEQKCSTVNAVTTNTYCGNRCEGLDGVWVSDPTDCQQYFYCRNGEALSGYCSGTQHFEESSQTCVYSVDSECVDVANICEILPDKTKFRNENDCSKYYECDKNGNHELKSCSTSKATKYFDVETGTCVAPNTVACTAHPKDGVCLNGSKPKSGYVTDNATCRGYFHCKDLGSVEDLNPTWYQCPEGYFFDESRGGCATATSVICTHNRCDGRGTMLVTSSSNECHNYIRCVNGLETEELTCNWDYFFDESIQACTSKIIYDGCCDGQD
ncbi:LOW QUALITY PROTEIN: peritrophin-44 [Drosophila tropicalis]|uniref:LOW QUALITY PROTEIN: peritrophin-44 n=1 Tax=Drosophila tropicalis TaxID=46794 RepID=UPI0035AB7897